MICKTCGAEFDDSLLNCPVCSAPANAPAQAPQQPTYQQPAYQAQQPNYQPQQPNYQPQQPVYQQPAYQAQPQYGFNPMGGYQVVLNQYVSAANSIHTLSICAIIFSLGCLGIILALISISKISSLPYVAPESLGPNELYIYQAAQKKVQTAKTLNSVTFIILGLSFIIGFIVGFVGAL